MTLTDFLGLLAGTLTTLAFVPQVWRVWRTRSTSDISMPMYAVFTSGTVAWLVYGMALGALPVILANVVTTMLAASVIVMKLRFESAAARKNL